MIIKNSALEETGRIDPRTTLPIRVSTTVRMKYRGYYSGQEFEHFSRANFSNLGNKQLNEVIAQDFARSYQNAIHMFISKKTTSISGKKEWIEIRRCAITTRPFNFFFSVIRQDCIDIIYISTVYKQPRKNTPPIKSTDEA